MSKSMNMEKYKIIVMRGDKYSKISHIINFNNPKDPRNQCHSVLMARAPPCYICSKASSN